MRIYSHYTFKQRKFKEDFVILKQVSRKNAKVKVEKDFYKFLHNANSSYDCRNNAGDCVFAPVFDEIEEFSYVKISKYQEINDFVSTELLEKQIEETYSDKLIQLHLSDEFYETKKPFEIQKKRKLS